MTQFITEAKNYQRKRLEFWATIAQTNDAGRARYYRERLKKIYGLLIPEGATILELGCCKGDLLAALKPVYGVGIDFCAEAVAQATSGHPQLMFVNADVHVLDLEKTTFDYIVVSDLVNDLWDIQAVLLQIRPYCTSRTRLIFNFHSHLWNFPLRIARRLGLANPVLRQNWITKQDLRNLLEISGFEPLRS
jgi:ubiquinone/menaquinone biosynthesis C-methylase UbiE